MAQIQPDYSENKFAEAKEGTHFARISAAEPKTQSNGERIIAWEMETFGNEDPNQNGKKLFHRTAIAGQYSGILNIFLKAANPDYVGGAFDTDDYIGKELEVTIVYPIDKKTGQRSQYSQVKKVAPYVQNFGGFDSTPAFVTEHDVP